MLYKKVHRQFVREFKVGREFKCKGHVFKVSKEPYIHKDGNPISILLGNCNLRWFLIPIVGPCKGQRWYKDNIEWLD